MSLDKFLSLISDNKEELQFKAYEKRKSIHSNQITFSRNVFVPVTHQCRNHCGYCGFVNDDSSSWITSEGLQKIIIKAKKTSCSEVLLTLGEKPEEKYETAQKFLKNQNCSTTVDYVLRLCEIIVKQKLLPHSNLGIVSYEELSKLKEYNASLGLMLESTSTRMLEAGGPHQFSPGKDPIARLKVIEDAGKLQIPFTTGILVGIGENWEERIESLYSISNLSQKYNHIQEVIIQNFNPQKNTPMSNHPPPSDQDILLTISLSRLILPSNVSIQVPPNLTRSILIDALNSGANDLGGISPITIDYINPNLAWHKERQLRNELERNNFTFRRRLPVYPTYERYLNSNLMRLVKEYHTNEEIIST